MYQKTNGSKWILVISLVYITPKTEMVWFHMNNLAKQAQLGWAWSQNSWAACSPKALWTVACPSVWSKQLVYIVSNDYRLWNQFQIVVWRFITYLVCFSANISQCLIFQVVKLIHFQLAQQEYWCHFETLKRQSHNMATRYRHGTRRGLGWECGGWHGGGSGSGGGVGCVCVWGVGCVGGGGGVSI